MGTIAPCAQWSSTMLTTYILAVACVVGIAAGQLLFKASANAMSRADDQITWTAIVYLVLAFILYGVTSIGWVFVLRSAALGKIYPVMALAFVVVPLASRIVYGEQYQPLYYIGVTLIVAGVALTARSL